MQKVGDHTYKIGSHTFETGKCSKTRSHKKADMQHILDLLKVKYLKSDTNSVLCAKIEEHIRRHHQGGAAPAPAAPAPAAPAPAAPAPAAPAAQQTRLTTQGLFFKGKLYPLGDCAAFAKNRGVTKKDLETLCARFGVSSKGTKETICSALRAKSRQSGGAAPVAPAAAAPAAPVVVPAAPVVVPAVMQQQQQLVYDAATDSIKVGAHRFTMGKCDAARFYKKDDLKAMAKKLKIPVASKDTNKVICDKIHAVLKVVKQKATAASPRRSPAPPAAAASPRRSPAPPAAAAPAAPGDLQRMSIEEIRASIRRCLNL